MKFSDIKPFTKMTGYRVNADIKYLKYKMKTYIDEYGLQMNPDFQRGHVWNKEQQIAFVEYALRGGLSGRNIYFNHPHWSSGKDGDFVLVDGLQRLTAMMKYRNNEIPAFGVYYKDMEDFPSITCFSFVFHVNELKTRADVLRWYLELNTGGVVHTKSELDRVWNLLEEEIKKEQK